MNKKTNQVNMSDLIGSFKKPCSDRKKATKAVQGLNFRDRHRSTTTKTQILYYWKQVRQQCLIYNKIQRFQNIEMGWKQGLNLRSDYNGEQVCAKGNRSPGLLNMCAIFKSENECWRKEDGDAKGVEWDCQDSEKWLTLLLMSEIPPNRYLLLEVSALSAKKKVWQEGNNSESNHSR